MNSVDVGAAEETGHADDTAELGTLQRRKVLKLRMLMRRRANQRLCDALVLRRVR
jgi:hypothetical protein